MAPKGELISEVSNGALSAAAAASGTVVADTGQLPAGVYTVEVAMHVGGVATAGVELVVEHRNAANSANVTVLGGCGTGGGAAPRFSKVTVAENERIRVVVGAVALPTTTKASAHIRAYRQA
jgi:hypothetical protein